MKHHHLKTTAVRFVLALAMMGTGALQAVPTESGATLHCLSQRLNGEATPNGLWVTSACATPAHDRFRVIATRVGRTKATVPLSEAGDVCVEGQTVRFSRPGLVEEYSVSRDGLRQDFVVEQPAVGPQAGELRVGLALSGARAQAASSGARLILENSGRQIAYNRLRATDATGKELPARMEIGPALFDEARKLDIVVNDAGAVYPVRIDPTLSDLDWSSIGSQLYNIGSGLNSNVSAVAVMGGALYAGGSFTNAGLTAVNYIAKWTGSSWAPLGSGTSTSVYALAVSGSTLYVGGDFTNPGYAIAQWNGSSWASLGDVGLNNIVLALAVSGSTLYAGGAFTTAGDVTANEIAQWNGSSWSAMGSGMNEEVFALAVAGGNVYAGGDFTTAGGITANYIAQWNGSAWVPLGLGVNGPVFALAVSGSTLYAGGDFTTAGDVTANYIAQWNGSSWSAMGKGMNNSVTALAVADVPGSTLYAGGDFTTAGASEANHIAQWDGANWYPLGSGVNGNVLGLDESGTALYACGDFTEAGISNAPYVAEVNLQGAPGSVSIVTNNAAFGLSHGQFGFDVSGPSGGDVAIEASMDLQTWIPLETNLLGTSFLHFSDSQTSASSNRFYRAVMLP